MEPVEKEKQKQGILDYLVYAVLGGMAALIGFVFQIQKTF